MGLYFRRIILILIASSFLATARTGKISGTVVDASTEDPLPGANVVVGENNPIGAATNIQGEFLISGVPAGEQIMNVTYIGYKPFTQTVNVKEGEIINVNIAMENRSLRGEDVIITAQVRGQTEAINQQISAKTVTNVVSSSKIRELPEANAAEAVGRLPGVSLERHGGEGTKVLIRGMGAKYTKVQIDGVNMTATGSADRSSDLSMISPYMLAGIELTKSVMANQEATATGGIVNFRIKKAPNEPAFNIMTQGGQNSLRETYNNYKLTLGGSNRFYSDLFGIYGQIDYEEKDAGSQQLGGIWFSQENEDAPVRTDKMQLRDIFRNVQRLGGTLVLDYTLPSTEIKSSNFYSRIKREETSYINEYDIMEQDFGIHYSDTPKRWLTVLTNSLQINHNWENWGIKTALSHSYSENILPAEISSRNSNSPQNPFPADRKSDYNVNLDPETLPDSMVIPIDETVNFMHLGEMFHNESKTRERNLAAKLDLAYNLNLTDQLKIKLNLGAKIKHKNKEFNQTSLKISGQYYLDMVYDNFEDELTQKSRDAWAADDQRLLLIDFIDPDYEGGNFLGGKYHFSPVFDRNDFRRIHNLAMQNYDPTTKKLELWNMVKANFIDSNYDDYHGQEDYYAFYLMPEIDITSRFTFVPGVRYESNRTEYTGYRGSRLGVLRDWRPTKVDSVTKVRKNEFLLPMIQTVFKPTNWSNIKAGYTHTLQRPNYNNIMPGWVIGFQGSIDNLSNFRLKPELSRNYDIQISVFSDKIGLLSVGAFYKKITDMIFWTGQTVVLDTAYFELPSMMHRQKAAYAVNNENDAINYGYEIEWQSNFWYLPGILKGLVVNVNYTRNISESDYLRTRIETKAEYDENWNVITYYVPNDTTYTSPMINQPDHLLNLTLGYDYKGFSIRWAMRYKSRIFTNNNWYEKLRGYSTDFYRYDLSVKQKLPPKGMELFLNVNNLTNEMEHSVINHMDFTSYLEDYGRRANLGFRYRF
jgi:TonB-dependent receptor